LAAPDVGIPKKYGPLGEPSTHDPQSDYRATWYAFKTTTEELRQTLGTVNTEAAALLTQIQTNAAFLGVKWNAWYRTNSPSKYTTSDEYLNSLHGDLRVLRKLKKEKDDRASLEVLRDVAFDLQLKGDNCRNSADGLGKEIKVKVHTKAKGKEIGGFEVCYVPKGLLDVKGAHDRFPKQSSPTDERILNPGRYAMWARKSGFTSEPVTLGIGGQGETRLEVDLEVPSD
jgi:hypothetical protein